MQSNGGVIVPDLAIEKAATTLLSGPAGGPVAGVEYASIQGYKDCITVDMGGTSFDVSFSSPLSLLLFNISLSCRFL